jgi:hypothetical protein
MRIQAKSTLRKARVKKEKIGIRLTMPSHSLCPETHVTNYSFSENACDAVFKVFKAHA